MVNRFRDPMDEWLKATLGAEANPMVTMLGKLTEMQHVFCREYVLTGSSKKAGIKAGLPASTNPALLVHLPKIAACINILTARREATLGVRSAAEVIERLRATPAIEEEDFGFGLDSIREREELLSTRTAVKGASTEDLRENIVPPPGSIPADAIMQLPKVKLPESNVFGKPWVIERYVTIAERCMNIEPVFDRKGRPVGEFKFDASGATRALDSLGRVMGMFKDKVEVSHGLAALGDADIEDRIRRLVGEYPSLGNIIEGSTVAPADEAKADAT